jgi:acyl-homoserine-lactone acylase
MKASAGEEVLNTRGERIFGVLTRPDKKFTLKQMISMGFDAYVLAADAVIPLLEQALVHGEPIRDARLRDAMDALKAWNRRSSTDSYAYTYLFYWAKSYETLFSSTDLRRFTSYGRNIIDIHFAVGAAEWLACSRRNGESNSGEIRKDSCAMGRNQSRGPRREVAIDGTSLFDVLRPDMGLEQPNGQIYCNDEWGHLMMVMEVNPKRIWSLLSSYLEPLILW